MSLVEDPTDPVDRLIAVRHGMSRDYLSYRGWNAFVSTEVEQSFIALLRAYRSGDGAALHQAIKAMAGVVIKETIVEDD